MEPKLALLIIGAIVYIVSVGTMIFALCAHPTRSMLAKSSFAVMLATFGLVTLGTLNFEPYQIFILGAALLFVSIRIWLIPIQEKTFQKSDPTQDNTEKKESIS